jgi:hypothetical protein
MRFAADPGGAVLATGSEYPKVGLGKQASKRGIQILAQV